jgi:endoglucanase
MKEAAMRSTLALALLLGTVRLGDAQAAGDGWWHTDGNRIKDAAGNEVRFSGVNWHGMDSENRIPHGLWGGTNRTIEDHLDQMKAAGFNLIRLPFSTDIFAPGAKPRPEAIDPVRNADLIGPTCLEILDRLVAAAGARGIRIILDYHRLTGGAVSESGHWYDAEHPEARWIANWKTLAARYRTDPTVVGVDLFNEVHDGVTWEADGVNPAHNWRWAAKRCADEILAVNPNLLICVQGLDQYKGEGGWWGAVHLGVKDHPLTLSVPNRLVYQVHDYGPIVWDQPFHQVAAGFPASLPAHWDRQWGFLHAENIAPVWVGEWGSFLDPAKPKGDRELQWAETLRAYIQGKGLSWTWWCWTPESHDTGGVILDGYAGIHTTKTAFLAPVLYPGFGGSAPTSPPGQAPFGGAPRAIPGTIEAEDFDQGGEGVAYHDAEPANQGGQYRTSEGVDVEATAGGYNVGWLAAGEWLEYAVDVAAAGTYTVEVRVASATSGGAFHLALDGGALAPATPAPATGGWQTWQTLTLSGLTLPAGTHVLRLAVDSGPFNVDRLTFALAAAAPPPAAPSPTPGPAVVEASDDGGSGDARCGCGTAGGRLPWAGIAAGLLLLRGRGRRR